MANHRNIVTTMQVTLDGRAGRPDGGTDFIGTGADIFDWELFDRADACVLGRVMYPEYEQYGPLRRIRRTHTALRAQPQTGPT
jgi:hypothetical protein